MLGEFL